MSDVDVQVQVATPTPSNASSASAASSTSSNNEKKEDVDPHAPYQVFWTHQICDHLAIIETLLSGDSEQGEAIKQAACLTIMMWMAVAETVKEEVEASETGTLGPKTTQSVIEVTEATTELIKGLIEVQKDPEEWLGWFFPSLLQHMVDEQDLFVRKLKGELSVQEEVIGYIRERKTAHAATEKLLDPTEEKAAAATLAAVDRLQDLEDAVTDAFAAGDVAQVRAALQDALVTMRAIQSQDLVDGRHLTSKEISSSGPGLINIFDHEANEGEHELWRLQQIIDHEL